MDASNSFSRAALARRAREDLPNLGALLVFLCVTAFLFRSWEFALIVVASLGFHELGHAALIARHGLEWRISFGLVGAWTTSPMEGRARLSQVDNATIHLAGPLFSMLLALIAYGLHQAFQSESQRLLLLANFSAQVGFLNLIPLGPLTDGGKALRRLTGPLRRIERTWAVALPLLASALAVLLYTLGALPLIGGQDASPFLSGLLLLGVWMGGSLLLEARRAPKAQPLIPITGGPPGPAMTRAQSAWVLIALWALLAIGLVLMYITPYWLAPEYVLGIMANMVALLRILTQLPL